MLFEDFWRATERSDIKTCGVKVTGFPLHAAHKAISTYIKEQGGELTHLKTGIRLLDNYNSQESAGFTVTSAAVHHYSNSGHNVVDTGRSRDGAFSTVNHKKVQEAIKECRDALKRADQCIKALAILNQNAEHDYHEVLGRPKNNKNSEYPYFIFIRREDETMTDAFFNAQGVKDNIFQQQALREDVLAQILWQAEQVKAARKNPQPRAEAA